MSWVLQLTLLLALQSGSDLNQVVHDYWTALAARDKVRAMEFVHPEDLNKFLNRHEPPIKDWKLERIEQPSELEASVTVTFVRPSPTGVLFLARAREVWQKLDSGSEQVA